MDQQRKVTTPSGHVIYVPSDFTPDDEQKAVEQEEATAKSKPSNPNTVKLRSMSDMLGAPIDTATGQPFKMNMPHPPRGTLPVLAGMASSLIPGGMALKVALGTLSGSAGEGAEEAIRGEKISPYRMATEGATQGAISAAPVAAPLVGRAVENVGNRMAGYSAGKVGKLGIGALADAALHWAGVPRGVSEYFGYKAIGDAVPVVESGVRAAGRNAATAGRAIADAATETTGQSMGKASSGPIKEMIVPGSRVPKLPDAIRKLQLLYRAITWREQQ